MLSKKEEWKKWRIDVEDYIETIDSGMEAVSETVAKEKEEIEEAWFDEVMLEVGAKGRKSTNCSRPKPAAKAGRSSSAPETTTAGKHCEGSHSTLNPTTP